MNPIVVLMVLVYNLVIVGGTAFLVAFHDWSAWWFVLAVLLTLGIVRKD